MLAKRSPGNENELARHDPAQDVSEQYPNIVGPNEPK